MGAVLVADWGEFHAWAREAGYSESELNRHDSRCVEVQQEFIASGGAPVVAAHAARGERSEPRAAGAAAPRAVTRGESPDGAEQAQVAKVDWLNCTFSQPSMSVEGFVSFLGRLFGRPTSGEAGRGLFGFQTGVKLRVYLGGTMVDVGALAYGGESQRGRWMLQLTGKGCGLLSDWAGMREFLEGLDAKITRLDLAVDFLDGAYTVDDAVRMHGEGGFTSSGRPPSTAVAGDWLDGVRGRTLYVGKATNGKMLRVYEKGIQMGEPESPWVRFEVQLGNRDREIPFDALTERDAFFAGCYPALAEMIDRAAQAIPTTRTSGEVTLAHLLYHAKRCYGKLFDVLSKLGGATDTSLVEEVRVIGIPRRLNPAGVVAGVEWPDVQAKARR